MRRAAKERLGLDGVSPRVLVVDNESDDRQLLIELLEPLGFTVREASSGHDALDLVAAGWVPDAVLMDLAMPGIDGWETIRRLRRMPHVQAKIAIVSANAFDKGLDNDVGIRPEDFILKPVRHAELLDWLERQLGLRWLQEPAATPAPAAPLAWTWPRPELLAPLQQAVQLGYYRGILNQLEAIDGAQPECAGFTAKLRELARQFQFEAIARTLADCPLAAQGGPR
jgi:CheY-like chemotaxis protein